VSRPRAGSLVARTSTWSGSAEALESWCEHVQAQVSGFVAGLPGNAGGMFFVAETDKFADQSRASTVEATGVDLLERGAYTVVEIPR
jgi:hypothetical protein